MRVHLYNILLLFIVGACSVTYTYAQKKHPAPVKNTTSKTTIQKDTTLSTLKGDFKPEVSPVLTRSIDTVIIIDKKTGKPIDPKNKQEPPKTATRKPDTIIYIDEPYKKPKPGIVLPVKDTVIVISKGRQTKQLLKDIPKSEVKVVKVKETCNCVAMNVSTQDTLRFEDYINYTFSFKNNCKEKVYINSSCFGFLVFNPNGVPVRTLRKVDFAKQYRYPEYVELRPGEEYMFQFGEDPFFRYDLRQGWKYKFTFTYVNTKLRYRPSPDNTYSCSQFRDKTVIVK